MDFKTTSKAPAIYRDPTYNSDNNYEMNTSSSSSSSSSASFYFSSSSSSSSSSSPASETSESETEFYVTLPPLPFSTFVTINTWLLSTWTFPLDPRYVRNLNLSELWDVQLFIWNIPAGSFIRELDKRRRRFHQQPVHRNEPGTDN